jgi:hypothetical protein
VSPEDAYHGCRDHRSLLDRPGAAVVSRATTPLDAFHAAGAPLAGTETPDSTLVLMTTV